MFLIMLEKLMEEHHLNKNQLSKKAGIPYTTINNFWVRGYENVAISTVKRIAAFFNVSLDYLVLGKTANSNGDHMDENEKSLINSYRNLTNEGQEYINKTMNMALSTYKKSSTAEQLQEDVASEFVKKINNVKSSV